MGLTFNYDPGPQEEPYCCQEILPYANVPSSNHSIILDDYLTPPLLKFPIHVPQSSLLAADFGSFFIEKL